MPRDSQSFLRDIERSTDLIAQFIRGKSREDYASDALLQAGVERHLAIIGEAIQQLRRDAPGVAVQISDYRKIVGLRNILVHRYVSVDADLTWDILRSDLGRLTEEVDRLLNHE